MIAGQDDPKNGNSGCDIHHLTRFVSVSYSLLVATCSVVLEFSESMLFLHFPNWKSTTWGVYRDFFTFDMFCGIP